MTTVGSVGGKARVTLSMSARSALARDIEASALIAARAMLHSVAEDARERAERAAERLYQPRPDNRKNQATAGTPLHGSFRSEVITSFDDEGRFCFPVRIRLWSEAADVKVHSLNSGAKPHVITARNVPWLKFPLSASRSITLNRSGVRRTNQTSGRRVAGTRVARTRRFSPHHDRESYLGGGAWTKVKKVNHPGIKPSYFMELAVEAAVEAGMRRQVKLARD